MNGNDNSLSFEEARGRAPSSSPDSSLAPLAKNPSGFELAWWSLQHEDAELFCGPKREPLFWDVEEELTDEELAVWEIAA
jgi:hypothetical protein